MSDLSMDDYFVLLAHSDNAEVRANAAWMMGRVRDMRSVDPLLGATHDPDALVRARVIEALGTIKDVGVVPALIEALQDDDADVRTMAGRSLGSVGLEEAVEPLLNAIGDPSPDVRAEIVQALGNIPDDRASQALAQTLILDSDGGVRHFARQALTHIGGESVTSVLVPALEQYKDDAGILMDLMEVLAQIYARSAIPAFQALTTHNDEGVRETAKWALKTIGV